MNKNLRKILHWVKNHFFQKIETVYALNVRFKTLDADISLLKYPSDVKSKRKES